MQQPRARNNGSDSASFKSYSLRMRLRASIKSSRPRRRSRCSLTKRMEVSTGLGLPAGGAATRKDSDGLTPVPPDSAAEAPQPSDPTDAARSTASVPKASAGSAYRTVPAVPNESTTDSVTMVPLLQSRSSEADAFQKLLKKYLIAQVLVLQSRVLLYTTRPQGERSVYCVELTADMPQGAYFSAMVTPSHEFRNSVVKMVDLSQGSHIRVGMLLSDCSFHISVFDPVAFRWPRKGFVYTKFVYIPHPVDDVSFSWHMFSRQIVYSPSCDMLFWTRIDPISPPTDPCRPPNWKLVMYDLVNRFEKPLMSLPGPAILTPMTHELAVLLRNHGAIFIDYTTLSADHRRMRLDMAASHGPGCSWQEARRGASQHMGCYYWHPNTCVIEFLPMRSLRPRATHEQLEGFCPCKESRPSFALKKNLFAKEATSGKKSAIALAASVPTLSVVILYGGTLFRLNGQVCAPLLRINIPAVVREPFYHVLYRDRVVVLHSASAIVIHQIRENSFRIVEGQFIVAGLGVVCSPTDGSVTKIQIAHEVVEDGSQMPETAEYQDRERVTQQPKKTPASLNLSRHIAEAKPLPARVSTPAS
ncbi:hypothetical protein BIW11_07048 [Tropilaelaps mercedesae]|uniref:Uncharacterized protein n=1 Tax=Tropilaelaps mercedesae TaxID=418985 RepID=A0A1V9XVH4_9ACAR|nr:hypothetical protein BIW11_07048 [Tropilaelaps mercedesae]